jgi:drug/metabolite transporter (DMT)-like permease
MAAVLLALAASASWGVSDFLGGLKARAVPVMTVLAVAQPAGLVLLAAIVVVHWQPPPHGQAILWAVLAGLGGAVGIGALYKGLAIGSMGIVAPITATSPLVPLTVGLARGERPSAVQLAGMGVALVGVVLAGWESEPGGRRRRAGAGVGLALLAAAAFGGSQVGLDGASDQDPYWAAFIVRLASCALVYAVLLRVRPARGPAGLWAALITIGLLDSGATVLFAVGTTKGLLSVVAVLAALYPVLVAVLARVLLQERLSLVQRGGALAAITGAAAIAAG